MIKSKVVFILLLILLLLSGCSQDVSKDAVKTDNSTIVQDEIVQQLKTDHFAFYSKEQDKDCIKDLSKTLEDNFVRITDDLKKPLTSRINVYIYTDLNSFHEAINLPEAPNWLVGSATDLHTIKMVNPTNTDDRPYADFMKVIVHEFTHIVVNNASTDPRNVPIWLNEGVAQYEAEQNEGVEKVLTSIKSTGKYPSLKNLNTTDANAFGTMGGYALSYSIVEYMAEAYGFDKVVEMIKSPSEFKEIFGMSEEDFQKEWIDHLK